METHLLNKTEDNSRFSTYLAIGSFVIGTVILLLHTIFPDRFGIMVVGFYYVLFAALINGVVLLHLLCQFCIYPKDREAIAIKMLIMIANIPIAILYSFIAIQQTFS